VFFTPGEVAEVDLADRLVVVVDVLRATSTIVEALANGARAVVPVATIEEALRLVRNLGREGALLCGERGGLRIEGFELGNSPAEFTAERVAGKTLVMTTTNGTAALVGVAGARRVYVGAFANLGAVAAAVADADADVAVVCAGRGRRFALEDALCAGALLRRVRARRGRGVRAGNDAAWVAQRLARSLVDPAPVLRRTAAARELVAVGLGADVEWCTVVDRSGVVPVFRERQVTL